MAPVDGSSDPEGPPVAVTPPQGPIEDPTTPPDAAALFFKAPFEDIRDSGNAALSFFTLESQLQRAVSLVPDDALSVDVESTSVNCTDQGLINATQSFSTEPNTAVTVRSHEFVDCQQAGSTFSGTIMRRVEQLGTGAASRTTTIYEFDVSIAGVRDGQGALSASGSLSNQTQIEFATPPNCDPANTLRRQIDLDDGSRYSDPAAGIDAQYQALAFSSVAADRFSQIETVCEVVTPVTYDATATGSFDSISAEPVSIVKTGVHSSVGIGDADAPAEFRINALASDDRLVITASGDTPTSVQVDIVDRNAVQSFTDTWDFAD